MEIWKAIAADPQTGARRLIAEYGDRLFAAAMILVQETHGAEDLVSRTFQQAVVKIEKFAPAYSFWNWLYTIMLNFHRSDLRKNRAEVAESPDLIETSAEDESGILARLSATDAELLRHSV